MKSAGKFLIVLPCNILYKMARKAEELFFMMARACKIKEKNNEELMKRRAVIEAHIRFANEYIEHRDEIAKNIKNMVESLSACRERVLFIEGVIMEIDAARMERNWKKIDDIFATINPNYSRKKELNNGIAR